METTATDTRTSNCEECHAPTSFERTDKAQPPEGEVCEQCGAWVCPNCSHPIGEPCKPPAPRIEAEAWSGSPDPADPDNYWIDDKTGERVSAKTGERSRIEAEAASLMRTGPVLAVLNCLKCGRSYEATKNDDFTDIEAEVVIDGHCSDQCREESKSVEAEATARPWHLTYQRYHGAETRGFLNVVRPTEEVDEQSRGEVNTLVIEPNASASQEKLDNFAALIVQAVNSRELLVRRLSELVAAAKALDDGLHAGLHISGLSVEQSVLYNSINDARAALALTEGKEQLIRSEGFGTVRATRVSLG